MSTRYLVYYSIFFGMTAIGFGQLKIGYIQSERIRTEYEDFTEAESQLQMEYQKVQVEYEKMIMQLDSLNKDYEVKRLMALDKGESIKQQIIQMERSIQTYQAEKVGPQGELMKKSAQMEYEILGKVREAVRKVAIDKGFDYIIDAQMGLLYVKPQYDMTDDVLHELRNLKVEK
ncbi:MAG: OmpH family outer membrane protein [Candidatus Neomarinimicrobiota bacterium]